MIKYFILFAYLVSLSNNSVAKDKEKKVIGRNPYEVIIIDLTKLEITPKVLPFDVPFVLKGEIPKDITKVTVAIINKEYQKRNTDTCHSILPDDTDYLSGYNQKKALKKETSRERLKVKNTKNKEEKRCAKPNYNTCTRLPAWKKSFINSRDNVGDIDTFTIHFPPIPPNIDYQFFISFERSVENERTIIRNITIPIIREFGISENISIPVLTQYNTDYLQTKLRNAVNKYYSDTYHIENATKLQLLDTAKSDDFNSEIRNTNVYNKTPSDLYDDLSDNALDFNAQTKKAKLKYDDILRHEGYRLLHNNIQRNKISGNNPRFKSLIQGIYLENIFRERIVKAQSTIDDPYSKLADISYKMKHDTISKYVANIRKTQNDFIQIKKDVRGVILDRTSLNNLALNSKEQYLLDSLIKKKNKTAYEKSKIRQYQHKMASLKSILYDLDTVALRNLITCLQEVEKLILERGEANSNIEEWFTNISDKSMVYSKLNEHSPMTSTADYFTRTGYYISLDIGMAYAFYSGNEFTNELVPYFGVNFHLAPINKQAKYKLFDKCNFGRNLYKNTSIIIGYSVNSLAINEKRENSLTNNSLLTGIGLRISDPVRLAGGVVWNNIYNSSPLNDSKELRPYPYISLSFDIDVAKHLGNLGQLIFPNIITQ